jgi:hypothetical protein
MGEGVEHEGLVFADLRPGVLSYAPLSSRYGLSNFLASAVAQSAVQGDKT